MAIDTAKRDEFIGQAHTAVLSTTGKDGTIHAVPVWYLWDGTSFRISTLRGSQKHKNIERTGRASLCIDQRTGGPMRWATAEGPVTFDAITPEWRLELWTHYRGDDAKRMLEAAGDNSAKSVCLVLTPEKWLGTGLG